MTGNRCLSATSGLSQSVQLLINWIYRSATLFLIFKKIFFWHVCVTSNNGISVCLTILFYVSLDLCIYVIYRRVWNWRTRQFFVEKTHFAMGVFNYWILIKYLTFVTFEYSIFIKLFYKIFMLFTYIVYIYIDIILSCHLFIYIKLSCFTQHRTLHFKNGNISFLRKLN